MIRETVDDELNFNSFPEYGKIVSPRKKHGIVSAIIVLGKWMNDVVSVFQTDVSDGICWFY